jgi:hypothetical protein
MLEPVKLSCRESPRAAESFAQATPTFGKARGTGTKGTLEKAQNFVMFSTLQHPYN